MNLGVQWLDIFDDMLSDPITEANRTGINITGAGGIDTLKLKDVYRFDGTHMHPNYVPLLLEPALREKL